MQRKLIYLYIFVVSACGQGNSDRFDAVIPADTIFIGENIITMDDERAAASGVAVRGGEIIAVGEAGEILRHRVDETRVVELGDQALLPGFVDAHGHFTATARLFEFVNLSPPPVGVAEDIADLVALLQQRIAAADVSDGRWVVGYGYDDSLLAEERHPTRDDLDAVSASHPVLLIHVSGHLAAANSFALQMLGIDADTPDPAGGVIRRYEASREPNGVFEETAASTLVYGRLGEISGDRLIALTRDAAKLYASYGITTVQDGAITPGDLRALREAAASEPYAIDIGAYMPLAMLSQDGAGSLVSEAAYTGGIRHIGVKFTLDGSPQGRTAWMTRPYAVGPPGTGSDYVAYPTMDPDLYRARVAEMIRRDIPVLVHANGDAAIDLMIDGVAAALRDSPKPNHRSVIVHAQLMRNDQLEKAAELGIVTSFFSAHTFFWGDWHRISFGEERAKNISPTRWAIDSGASFTLHNDAPIVPPDMMRLIWATVNRTTRSGFVLGPEQRLTVAEALRAVTLTGAYQCFEEDRKGSIRAGKQADLVVLGTNPLRADPASLKDIAVVETFSRGRSVYRNPEYKTQ